MTEPSSLPPPPPQIKEHPRPAEDDDHAGKQTALDVVAHQIEHQRLKNRELKQNIEERRVYAAKVYRLVGWCLAGVAFFVFLQGLPDASFQIDDKVLIAIITSATANVIGLFVIIVRYLFRGPEREKTKD